MKKLYLILLTLLVSLMLLSEENQKSLSHHYSIQTIADNYDVSGKEIVKEIRFINNETANVVRKINLFDDNPYNSLPYQKDVKIKNNQPYIDYPNVTLNELYSDLSWMDEKYSNKYKNKPLWSNYTKSSYTIKDDIVIIHYSISSFATDHIFLAKESEIHVYNKKGERIFYLDKIYDGIGGVCITKNRRFIGYSYGKQVYSYGRNIFKGDPGIKVFDLTTQNLIYKKEFNDKEKLKSFSVINDLFFYTTDIFEDDKITKMNYFVDIEKEKVFSGTLNVGQWNRIKSFSNDGILFGKTYKGDVETEFVRFDEIFRWESF